MHMQQEIEQLKGIIAEKDRQLAEKDQRILKLEGLLGKALERITELERRLGMNSQNSSKPPSSDGYRKPTPQSLRETGKKASGGQQGHAGKTLSQTENPDFIEVHRVDLCENCQQDLGKNPVEAVMRRQVFDIPVPQIEVTEHQAEIKTCPCCGYRNRGQFPKGVRNQTQYGNQILGMAVYFSVQQLIPEDRVQSLFSDIFGLKIATATLVEACTGFSRLVTDSVSANLDQLKASNVKHLDETGIRIGGKTRWLHVISTDKQTHYRVSEKRGNLLDGLTGIVVHDHWKPYFTLQNISHALCNAHHLRELKALTEIDKEPWAQKMTALLLAGNTASGHLFQLPPAQKQSFLKAFFKKYDRIIQAGLRYHDAQKPLLSKRKKRRVGHNLLLRLQKFKVEVLRFLTDPEVPFTNNQAEQDIRMMKVKQKISGGFRTMLGADTFCTIRSFLSSARKQNQNIFQSILAAYA